MINLREATAAKLGMPISDLMWGLVYYRGYVEDHPYEPVSERASFLADEIRQLLRVMHSMTHVDGESVVPDRLRGAGVSARIDALSAIYAAWADQDSSVQLFRNGALVRHDTPEFDAYVQGGGTYPDYQLLTPEQVSSWIKDQHNDAAADGDGDGHVRQLVGQRRAGEPPPIVHLGFVADGREQVMTVDRRSPLGDLAKVADSLAEQYRWLPSEAATFVLTGQTPEVFVYIGSAQIRSGTSGSAATRVTMTLDPFLTPEQVADIYARLRAQLRLRAPRSLSVKHYRLAQHVGPHVTFYVQQPKHARRAGRPPAPGPSGLSQFVDPVDGHTWQSLRRDWNDRCSEERDSGRLWRYDHASNFIRDAKNALERLLHPGWKMWSE